MDPCAQYAMVTTMEAIQDAGLDLDKIDKDRVGVIFGTGIGGFSSIMESAISYVDSDKIPHFSPYLILKVLTDLVPGYISLKFGFKGPNYVTSAACASSANALVDAFHIIQYGKADMVVSGGTEACIVEAALGGFNAMRALSTRNDMPAQASRPFDTDRDGFVMGEGAATLILEELDHALARGAKIYAELAGIGMSADAYHVTAPDPEGKGAETSMRLALEDANIQPEDVDYINMHGTSTPLGDIAECLAIDKLFGAHAEKMVLNSTKSMTGHLLGAAPAIESVAVMLSMRDQIIHPTINVQHLDPKINPNWNFALDKTVSRPVHVALTNSFGFGGHNVSLVYKQYFK